MGSVVAPIPPTGAEVPDAIHSHDGNGKPGRGLPPLSGKAINGEAAGLASRFVLSNFCEVSKMENSITLFHAAEETFFSVDPTTGAAEELPRAEQVAETIEEFKATESFKAGTYNKLHTVCVALRDSAMNNDSTPSAVRAAVESELEAGEMIFIKANYSRDEIDAATTKAGKIKTTKFLPGDYRSAKSVILNAIENGVSLFDADGEALGKSALQKGINEATGSEKTDQQRLDEALQAVIKYAARIHEGATLAVRLWKDGDIIEERTN